MIIKQIVLDNWLCYRGRHELDVPSGAVAIVAEYDGSPDRSNWAGKTALLESIVYALWGWHRKRLVGDVITWGESACMTFVDLEQCSVTRARGPAGPETKFVSEGLSCGGRDAEDAITGALGLSWEDASSSVVVQQGELTAFVKAPAAKRQEVIASWLAQGHWQKCEARAREEARAADQEENGARAIVTNAGLPTDEETEAQRQELALLDAQIVGLRGKLEAEESLFSQAQGEAKLRAAAERFDKLKAMAKEHKDRLAKPPVEAPDGSIEKVRVECAELERDIRAVATKIEKAWDSRCPLTDQRCPVSTEVMEVIGSRENRQALEGERARQQTQLGVVKLRFHELAERQTVAEKDARERALAEDRLTEMRDEGRALKVDAERGRALGPGKPDSNAYRTRLRDELASCEREAGRVRGRLEANAARAAKVKVLRDRIPELEARANLLWEAAKAFGRNGIQGIEADAALAEIEKRANEVLSETGLMVQFATAREGQKLEPGCQRCGRAFKGQKEKQCPCGYPREASKTQTLDVLVTESGRQYDVSECSGGAQTLVGAACRLAAAALLRSLRDSAISFLLVDEPFASLDAANRKILAQRLGPLARSTGFDQVLVVTHDPDLSDSFPARILVRRGADGFSRLG
jgi:DNA repair exonuclease SbcCD ATPase subunit